MGELSESERGRRTCWQLPGGQGGPWSGGGVRICSRSPARAAAANDDFPLRTGPAPDCDLVFGGMASLAIAGGGLRGFFVTITGILH